MDIKNKAQFIEHFSKGIKDIDQLKIGVERERFLFEGQNRERISYLTLKKSVYLILLKIIYQLFLSF